jgi:hypothetical protein
VRTDRHTYGHALPILGLFWAPCAQERVTTVITPCKSPSLLEANSRSLGQGIPHIFMKPEGSFPVPSLCKVNTHHVIISCIVNVYVNTTVRSKTTSPKCSLSFGFST